MDGAAATASRRTDGLSRGALRRVLLGDGSKRGAVLRAGLAAPTIVALADEYLDFERELTLRFVHALVTSWNAMLDGAFDFVLGMTPFELDLTHADRNIFLFLGIVFAPAFFGLANAMLREIDAIEGEPPWRRKAGRFLVQCLQVLIVLLPFIYLAEREALKASPVASNPLLQIGCAGLLACMLLDYSQRYLAFLACFIMAILSLELFYHLPAVEAWAVDYIEWSQTLKEGYAAAAPEPGPPPRPGG